MAKVTIRNKADGPRGAWAGGNLIMLEAGQEAKADFTDVNPDWFEVVGKVGKSDKPEAGE